MEIKEIDLRKIQADKNQPRKEFNEQSLQLLADSLQKYGLIQPILLREKDQEGPQDPSYIIIAGERRFRAAKIAGFTHIPAIIRNKDAYQELALVENLQRKDLSPIEQAIALKTYMKEHQVTQEQMANIISKSRSYVANSLRLLKLPEPVKAWVNQGKLSDGHARALLSEKSAHQQILLAKQIVDNHWSVRKTEAYTRKNQKNQKVDLFEMDAINQLEEELATKVAVDQTQSGTIRIHFFNPEHKKNLMTKLLETLKDGV